MTLPLIISLISLVLAITTVFIVVIHFISLRKEREKQSKVSTTNDTSRKLEQEVNHLKQYLTSFKKQIAELRATSMGMSEQMLQLTSKVDNVVNRQDEIALQDPEGKLYSRASRMIELGAEIDELITECELPRAEVELLIRLHKNKNK